jgi:type I restriction-modification system DNA methylase subunit
MASQMKNTAPASIQKLVETFEKNLGEYRSSKNETELRREFLDKFFTALGWDVDNLQGAREAEKEVAHEFSVEIDGQQKKADYAFRIKRDSAIAEKFDFLVEAKKPSVKIESDLDAAFQIRRYGWSARIPINILTDFEHFAVYDCRVKPKYGEKAVLNRQMLFHYKEYIEKWDEIVNLFSPEAIRAGSLSEYVKSIKGKKGTADVDDDFLQEIERWRELLAKNIASNNEWIDISGLNYAVQMIIDRIIFLRICEERSIEPENQLQDITNKENIYKELCSLFKRADTKYNSGLFHFAKEAGEASRADDLTLRLDIDDKTLKDIILNLYYPKSPYAFLYIPSDILGQVYERFLGKVIRLTDGHRAKVEEKSEVRKAGGVFYTPTFIVTYIVINTLRKLLFGLTPKEAVKLTIVDPACGSGTFLLGAFEYLLAWHLKWYSENNPEKWVKNKVIVKFGNDYRLTTSKKKDILLNNIYGVDIDAQAVEVTKLSLLLKVLENASGQLELGMERILPDLGNNIKCGNSLVGEDYFEGKLMVDQEERNRVNPFDWESAFPEVFAQGGFDVVIGNPPYVRQESLSIYKDYFQKKFESFASGADLYIYFIEQGIKLLRPNGLYSIIVSSSFLKATYGKPLRKYITENNSVIRIVDFGGLSIFEDAKDTYVCIPLISKNSQTKETEICKVKDLEFENLDDYVSSNIYIVPSEQLDDKGWSLENQAKTSLFQKIMNSGRSLGEYSSGRIYYGIKTGLNDAFELTPQQYEEIIAESPRCKDLIKLFVGGQDIRRYHITNNKRFLIVVPSGWTKNQLMKKTAERNLTENYAWEWFSKEFKPLAEHLKKFSDAAKKRQDKGDYWWELRSCDYYEVLDVPKIIYPDIAKFPRFFLDTTGVYIGNTAYCLGLNDYYLLGILNSKLTWFAISQISIPFGVRAGEFRYRLIYQYMEQLPIRTINFNDPAEKSAHDKIVSLVESMLGLHKSLASAQNPIEKERLERQIKSTDVGVDKLVYELYGLSEEEITIVESK